jgi:hypothetical protein
MSLNAIKYHTTLAEYFTSQPLYLDEEKEKPNTRKLVEQPWQQTKAEMWDDVIVTLCDLLLIEAKCKAGMVYELGSDYNLTMAALPENQEKQREDRERESCLQHWTVNMITFAKEWSKRRDRRARGVPVLFYKHKLPSPIPTCRRWTDEEIEVECQRIMEHPNRLDRLTAFEGLVMTCPHLMCQ